jgi:hypothetical protein
MKSEGHPRLTDHLPPTPLPSLANPILIRFSPLSPKISLKAARIRSSKKGKNSKTLRNTVISSAGLAPESQHSRSIDTDINGIIATCRLGSSSVQDDCGESTSGQASSSAAHDSTCPSDSLNIRGLDVFFVDAHALGQDVEDLVVGLGGFDCGDESGVESVVAVHGMARVALEEDVEVDQVEQQVSDDLAEV